MGNFIIIGYDNVFFIITFDILEGSNGDHKVSEFKNLKEYATYWSILSLRGLWVSLTLSNLLCRFKKCHTLIYFDFSEAFYKFPITFWSADLYGLTWG